MVVVRVGLAQSQSCRCEGLFDRRSIYLTVQLLSRSEASENWWAVRSGSGCFLQEDCNIYPLNCYLFIDTYFL